MDREETTRSKKVAHQIQRDISDIFMKECRDLVQGSMVSVTVVRMSPDFELARVYLSIFPFNRHAAVIEHISENSARIRHALGKRLKNTLRAIPEVAFFVDDSLEYASNINRVMDGIVISAEDEDESWKDDYKKLD